MLDSSCQESCGCSVVSLFLCGDWLLTFGSILLSLVSSYKDESSYLKEKDRFFGGTGRLRVDPCARTERKLITLEPQSDSYGWFTAHG